MNFQASDCCLILATYDYTGQVDYINEFNAAIDAYTNLTIVGGMFNKFCTSYGYLTIYLGGRVKGALVDTTSRTGYSLVNTKPKTAHQLASEYYMFDWEYAQTPEQTSWIASSWVRAFFSSSQRTCKRIYRIH